VGNGRLDANKTEHQINQSNVKPHPHHSVHAIAPFYLSAVFGFYGEFFAHVFREKKFACMKYQKKSICKTFSDMGVTFRDESNDDN